MLSLIYKLHRERVTMDKADAHRLEAVKRDKRENEEALARALFPDHADRLQRAIRSQDREIARLESQA